MSKRSRSFRSSYRGLGINDASDTTLALGLGCLLAIVLFVGILFFRALVVYGAWNLGIVNVVPAVSDNTVEGITYFWTSVGVAFVWSILGGIFRRGSSSSS